MGARKSAESLDLESTPGDKLMMKKIPLMSSTDYFRVQEEGMPG
jgi:hypothetical protein